MSHSMGFETRVDRLVEWTDAFFMSDQKSQMVIEKIETGLIHFLGKDKVVFDDTEATIPANPEQ